MAHDHRKQHTLALRINKFIVMFWLILGYPNHVWNWVSNFHINTKWFDDGGRDMDHRSECHGPWSSPAAPPASDEVCSLLE